MMLHLLKFLTGPVFQVSGQKSSNNPFRITLGMGGEYTSAVLAQERYEQVWFRLAMLLVGLPAAFATGHLAGLWLIAPIPFMMSAMLAYIPAVRRFRELRGVALDVAIAARLGADRDAYESRKAMIRALGYKQFRGWTEADVKAKLVSLRPWAEKNAGKWG